jgi:hypothetical protein
MGKMPRDVGLYYTAAYHIMGIEFACGRPSYHMSIVCQGMALLGLQVSFMTRLGEELAAAFPKFVIPGSAF